MSEQQGADAKELSLWQEFRSFDRTYWIANWMELIERFAYYGARVVCPVFMVAALADGGLEMDQIQKASIFAIWAAVQSFVPILSGGMTDRYGYKASLCAATIAKIIGYIIMGYSVAISGMLAGGMPLAEAREAGRDHSYSVFLFGAVWLAFGTAIFKPGLGGLLVRCIPKRSAALGWGMFFQMVNIGAFLGPLLAGALRVLKWEYVFIACSVGISLNFIALFLFKEPERGDSAPKDGPLKLAVAAFRGLLEPRLFFFTISFAGFWAMAYQFFDLLPNYIDDWVDSRGLANFLVGIFGKAVPLVEGGNLTQEWMLNFNALLISIFAFMVGYAMGKLRSLAVIVIGVIVSVVAMSALGMSLSGWWILAVIGLFSVGEMMASPTTSRYLASIAPRGKEALYQGYSGFTVGIGWSLGSIVAGGIYQTTGDKSELARKYLVENQGIDAGTVSSMTKGEVMPFFENTLGLDRWGVRDLLFDIYTPEYVWWVFTGIGVLSFIAIFCYNVAIKAADANPGHGLNTKGPFWVRVFLVPMCAVLCFFTYRMIFVDGKTPLESLGMILNCAFFCIMLGFSLLDTKTKTDAKEA